MTLSEIDTTLTTLIDRHPGLTEAQLIVLLEAGGWETTTIKEASVLFRAKELRKTTAIFSVKKPVISTEKIKTVSQIENGTSPQVTQNTAVQKDVSILHTEIVPYTKKDVAIPEPVFSLVVEPVGDTPHIDVKHVSTPVEKIETVHVDTHREVGIAQQKVKGDEPEKDFLPHNLPLRPYETSHHMVPFSTYKKMFYEGIEDDTFVVKEKEKALVDAKIAEWVEHSSRSSVQVENSPPPQQVEEKPIITTQVVLEEQPRYTEPNKVVHVDTKLVVLTACMLLVILLLLGYMYSNGRL